MLVKLTKIAEGTINTIPNGKILIGEFLNYPREGEKFRLGWTFDLGKVINVTQGDDKFETGEGTFQYELGGYFELN